MGVPRLWPLLAPARRLQTLEDLSMEYFHSTRGYRALRLGIDTSMVMIMAEVQVRTEDGQKGYLPLSAPQTNRALLLLFNFALELLNIPTVLPLFVYDGARRPNVKRGRTIKIWPFRLEHRFRSMCEGLGFEWEIAPGEAEWEMASLAREGWLDGCWTGDSDIFLADAPLIVRLPLTFDPLSSLSTLKLEIYTRESLLSSPLHISAADCICLSMLLGGDYAKGLFDVKPIPYVALPLWIPKTLLGLSQSPFPSSPNQTYTTALHEAAYAPLSTRPTLLAQWSSSVLSSPLITSLPPQHAPLLPPEWPSILALSSYLQPLITPTPSIHPPRWFPPSIPKMIDTLLDVLTLTPSAIVDVFERDGGVWEGMCKGWMRREGLRGMRGGWEDLKYRDEVGIEWEQRGEGVGVEIRVWREVLRVELGEAVDADVDLGERWEGWRGVQVRGELVRFLRGGKEEKKSFNPIDIIVLD